MENYVVKSVDKASDNKKFELFIGRWQPFHEGHQWLLNQQLHKNKKICIAIRDVPKNDKNWWSAEEIKINLEDLFKNEIEKGTIKIIIIPDINSVNIGRKVGYDIIEHIPPDEINEISATKIRSKMDRPT